MSDLINPLKLSSRLISLLTNDFTNFKNIDPAVHEKIIHYIIDNGSYEDFQEILRLTEADRFQPTSHRWRTTLEKDSRQSFIQENDIEDIQFYWRLARIYGLEYKLFGHSGRTSIPIGNSLFFDTFIYSFKYKEKTCMRMEIIEEMFIVIDKHPDTLAKAIFFDSLGQGKNLYYACNYIQGFAQYCLKYSHVIIEALKLPDQKHRRSILSMIIGLKLLTQPLMEGLVELAISQSKLVQQMAIKLILKDPNNLEPAISLIKSKIENGKAVERFNGLNLLWQLKREKEIHFLIDHKKHEKSPKILSLLESILSSCS